MLEETGIKTVKLINAFQSTQETALWRWGIGELDLGRCESVECMNFYVLKLKIECKREGKNDYQKLKELRELVG